MDKNITIFLNDFLSEHNLLHDLAVYNALVPLAMITGLWFSSRCEASRGRLIMGVCAALAVTALSRGLQMTVAIHHRPILEIPLNSPPGYHFFYRLSSFPSDHATLVFGLSTVVFLGNRWLGLISFVWMMLVCTLRVGLGLHYPSDILGGLILGVAAVALSQWVRCPEWIWRFKKVHGALFYSLMMVGAYETANYFSDVLELLGVFR